MVRREEPDWGGPGGCGEQQPSGWLCCRGPCAVGEALGFWGSALASWAQGSPLSPAVTWDV